MIGLVSATAAGRAMARRLADAWPDDTTVHSGPVAEQVQTAWRESTALVCFLATGATVRLLAPLLSDKHTDPGVVCVDEAGAHAIALLGGHGGPGGGGANALAERVAEVLGARPVVSTATDATGLTALDTFGADLGFRLADRTRLARVSRALLDGAGVHLAADATWPLPALSTVDDETGPVIAITDRTGVDADLVYRPPSLVLGVGASRGVPADEVDALIAEGLASAGLAPESVRAVATVDVKADEAGIVEVANRHGWPLLTFPADELAKVAVPNPSEVVRAAVGTPSVAEAAALLGARIAGREATLVLAKRSSAMATLAIARLTPRGRLTIVGLGPGAADLRTPRATEALRRAGIVVGLDQYVAQVRHLLRPGTRVLESGLGDEEQRARTAVELATAGHAVALIGSGDAGVYAMASPALQLAGPDVDVDMVPGITAALAAAALLGAPLGHDHAYLSLSDLHTPWPVIADRVRACAAADLVLCLYNPRSAKRTAQFGEALAILAEHRKPETPVGVVRDASRPGERLCHTTLGALVDDPSIVDMRSVVVVGSGRTTTIAGRMVTPREYRWLP
ncbi:MAG: precorrin-3B C(17)-methyltransferase [Actinobacteria bacterium 13_2_20CM_2_71_6]|nr:MAG: precorrin-3B C(17)-methyltransferase [Actinobacteria bacterium 13_2_20CM_2_71_6]